MRKRAKAAYMISVVAENYGIHPQTLRLYERQGLLRPSRSDGNTRLYTEEDLQKLELILNLTRDLGVNLAGVEVILNMREKMDQMQREFSAFMELVKREINSRSQRMSSQGENALVPSVPPRIMRSTRSRHD